MCRSRPEQGFTLLELLVAMAIFALSAWLAYGGLRQVLAGRDVLLPKLAEQTAVWRALGLMTSDLDNLAPRPIRDALGGPRPALESGGASDSLLELTRRDPARALLASRSELCRISYRLENGQLWHDLAGAGSRAVHGA